MKYIGFLLAIAATLLSAQDHHHDHGSQPFTPSKTVTCSPSPTSICVYFGSAFGVDSGSGIVNRGTLTLHAGTTYTFVAAQNFSIHQFIITTSSVGGTSVGRFGSVQGVTGTSPLNLAGNTLTFTPLDSQIGTNVYYQCQPHTNLGAQITIAAALPVEMTEFTATDEGLVVTLRWRTATETDNAGFALERRLLVGSTLNEPAQGEWTEIGFVAGAGTSNAPHSYSITDAPGSSGRFAYRVRQIDRSGTFTYAATAETEVGAVPKNFLLEQNFPNPFNPRTSLAFSLAHDGLAALRVYDVRGAIVRTLFDGSARAGYRLTFSFDASGLATGTYIARLDSDQGSASVKMLFLK